MASTPTNTNINFDLLAWVPDDAKKIIDVGCTLGQMAFACKEINPKVHYTGIEINPEYANVAATYCDEVFVEDIEKLTDYQLDYFAGSDCWIFGNSLEHLRDPWAILAKVRKLISPDGCVLVCIPNAQHWSVQFKLLSGEFRYEDSGLMDKTHIRWFTKTTLFEMFAATGWMVEQGMARVLNEIPEQAAVLRGIRAFARAFGVDPDTAANEALAFQYVFKLKPRI